MNVACEDGPSTSSHCSCGWVHALHGKRSPRRKGLREATTDAHQILASVLHTPHQITKLLIGDARNEHKGQLARGKQPYQPPCVTPVGLHPVTRGLRHRPRRHDPHIYKRVRCRPILPQTPQRRRSTGSTSLVRRLTGDNPLRCLTFRARPCMLTRACHGNRAVGRDDRAPRLDRAS